MTFKQKILLIPIFMTVALLILAFISWKHQKKSIELFDQVEYVYVKSLDLSYTLENQVEQVDRMFQNAIAVRDSNFLSITDSLYNAFIKAIDKPYSFQTDQIILSAIRDLFISYFNISKATSIEIIEQGYNFSQIENIYKMNQMFVNLDNKLKYLVSEENKKLQNSIRTVRKSSNTHMKIVFSAIVVFLSLLTILTLAPFHAILQPLKMIIKVTQSLSKGIFEHDITYQAKDEMGQLADAYRYMLKTQQEKIQAAQQIAAGNLDINIPVASKHDLLGQSLSIMVQKLENDIKEKKRAAQELFEAKEKAEAATRAKSDFLANMSHEIRTPMNGVLGMADVLLEAELKEEQLSYVRTIKNSAESLLVVINDILDFSKIEAGHLDLEFLEFNLLEIVEDIIDVLALRANMKNIELAYVIDPDVPIEVKGDPGRLRQILINIIGNAIKFTNQGEVSLHISVEGIKDNELYLVFKIKDTGIGIKNEKLDILFKPFTQGDSSTNRKYGGTGLGLSISAKLVELMKGRIGVESEYGRGSTFSFTLQLKTVHMQRENPVRKELKDKKILIIDYNSTNLNMLNYTLELWGCQPSVISDELKVLQLLQENVEKNTPFQILIISDKLSHINSEELTKSIKKNNHIRDTKIVLMSAEWQNKDKKYLNAHKFDALLPKPLKLKLLVNALYEAMGIENVEEAKEINKTEKLLSKKQKKNKRILLVEDNFINQKVGLKLLENMGYHADIAGNGSEALKVLETIPHDLVLMDVNMPEMDGLEATQKIRNSQSSKINSQIPIIAMTALALKGDCEKCLEAGMDDYVSKPINPDELEKKINKWILISSDNPITKFNS